MKKILALLTALMITIQAHASIAVAPTRIEINANKTKANYIATSVEVRGDAKQPVRFRVYPGYFTINEKSEMVQYDKSEDKYNMAKKIKFVPSEFTVQPNKVQKLRINIININSLPDGENRAILYLEDVNAKEFGVDTGIEGIGAQLIVKTRMGIPIYVDKGKFTKKAEIESLNIVNEKNGLYTKIKVLSTGNSKIRYAGKVQIIKDKKLITEYTLPEKVVGSNNYYIAKDKIQTNKVAEKGEYTLRVILTYTDENGKKQNIKQEAQINI